MASRKWAPLKQVVIGCERCGDQFASNDAAAAVQWSIDHDLTCTGPPPGADGRRGTA